MINDAATVSVVSGGNIYLDINGATETIGGFVVNGFVEPSGVYGAGLTPPAGASSDADSNFGNDPSGTFTVVPEPASIGLLGFGAIGLLSGRRRRVQNQAK